MEFYQNTYTDAAGNIINGATVTVFTSLGAVATIYDHTGTPQANPFLTGLNRSEGEIEFAAADGVYDIKIENGAEVDWVYAYTLFDISSAGTPLTTLGFSAFMQTLVDDTSAFIATGTLKSGYVVANKTEAAALSLTSADAGRKLFITSADGGEFTIEYNATPSTYADNGGSYCGTQFIPSGGDGTIGIVRDYNGPAYGAWFGVQGDGTTNDRTTIQTGANVVTQLYLPETSAGYNISGGTVTIPVGHAIIGDAKGLNSTRFMAPNVTSSSVPEGTFFNCTDTTYPVIALRTNSQIIGINFFYPNQNWTITSLAESFVTYPTCIQIGDATEPSPFNSTVKNCNFLGGTDFIKQYDTTGNPVRTVIVEGCGGWVINGTYITLNNTTDVSHIRHCHLSPNYMTSYVTAKGGSAIKFRTKAITNGTKIFNLGRVDEINVFDFFVFGVTTFCDFNNNTYTGDLNEGYGMKCFGVSVDACQVMFKIQRSSPAFGLSVNGGFCTPIVRPNGVAGDSANQHLLEITAGVVGTRANFTGIRVYGVAVGEFDAGYSGASDYTFDGGAALAASNVVLTHGCSFANFNTGIKSSNVNSIVILDSYATNDVFIGGRARTILGPFTYSNLNASNSGEFMYIPTANSTPTLDAAASGLPVIRGSRISALILSSGAAITAGSCTITPWINGSPATITASLDSSNQRTVATQENNNDTLVNGDYIQLRISSDASFAPVTSDIVAFIEITDKE